MGGGSDDLRRSGPSCPLIARVRLRLLDVKECGSMRAWSLVGRRVGAVLVWLAVPATAAAQTPRGRAFVDGRRGPPGARAQPSARAQRLNVDLSKADEITAALKPNPVFTSVNENFPVFSPSQLTLEQLRQQPELRRVAQLPVRARRQAREAHAGRARHDRGRRQDRGGRRAAADVPDPAGLHQRAAGEVDAHVSRVTT